jgi:hypothetical protein
MDNMRQRNKVNELPEACAAITLPGAVMPQVPGKAQFGVAHARRALRSGRKG